MPDHSNAFGDQTPAPLDVEALRLSDISINIAGNYAGSLTLGHPAMADLCWLEDKCLLLLAGLAVLGLLVWGILYAAGGGKH